MYSGKEQKLTGVVLADLHSRPKAEALAKRLKGQTLKAGASELQVSAARTEVNSRRNANLRDAAKAVKDSGLAVELERGDGALPGGEDAISLATEAVAAIKKAMTHL